MKVKENVWRPTSKYNLSVITESGFKCFKKYHLLVLISNHYSNVTLVIKMCRTLYKRIII